MGHRQNVPKTQSVLMALLHRAEPEKQHMKWIKPFQMFLGHILFTIVKWTCMTFYWPWNSSPQLCLIMLKYMCTEDLFAHLSNALRCSYSYSIKRFIFANSMYCTCQQCCALNRFISLSKTRRFDIQILNLILNHCLGPKKILVIEGYCLSYDEWDRITNYIHSS